MIKADKYFIDNLNNILENGAWDENPRPKYADGTPAKSKFITQVFEKYDISNHEFPLITLRNTAIKTGIREILWIYQKQSNSLDVAHEMGINWWDEWNVGDNTIGERYGYVVKKYNLINNLLEGLKNDPFSRRHIMNLYQYESLKGPGLHPCAYETIWSVRKVGDVHYIDMTLIQRSQDFLVTVGINKIQYVALMMMIAGHLGYRVGIFSHLVQNLHIYDRHFDAANEILSRTVQPIQPNIKLLENKNFFDYTVEDFVIFGTENIKKLNNKLELAI